MKKTNKSLVILILISTLYLIVSVSYSYFAAIITGAEDSTTISLDSGKLEINYDGGEVINVSNIYPDDAPFAVKNFTVTGTNTVSEKYLTLDYSLILKVTLNTFTDNAISYSLESAGTNGNLLTKSNTPLKTGSQNEFIGNAFFSGTVTNEIHNYTLNIFFLDTGVNQSEDLDKSFDAHVVIGEKIPFNNPPKLTQGMTPIKYSGYTNTETNELDPEWYDYENKKWANAKTNDGSYWVWIPRYAYKIASCFHMSASQCQTDTGKEAGEIEVKFLNGTTNETFTGETVSLSPTYSGSSQTNFIKHPAFTFGEAEREGFWVSKFEISGPINNLASKPNGVVRGSIDVYEAFDASMSLKSDPKFGWDINAMDSYMLKNIEWGALAYLAHSQIGANDEIYINNDCGYQSGRAGGTPSASSSSADYPWDTAEGVMASSTHNITGVYDMSGGANEYVAAYYSGSNATRLAEHGQLLVDSYNQDGNKYVDVYDSTNISSIFGDAMYETSSSSIGDNSWYKDASKLFSVSSPFLRRGGVCNYGEQSGIFYYNERSGGTLSNLGFRVSLNIN